MRVYVVRHGDAVSDKVDPARPLSKDGRAIVQRAAGLLRESGVRVPRVLYSGKTRAAQTAEILAESVGDASHVQEMAGLKPLDPVAPMVRAVNEWTDDTMIVSHLPLVGSLVSRLVTGTETVQTVFFQPATTVCLLRLDDDTWTILWIISPDLLVHEDS